MRLTGRPATVGKRRVHRPDLPLCGAGSRISAAGSPDDRLAAEGTPVEPSGRTPLEVRERSLAMFKQDGDRYAIPFSGDRRAAISLNERWADYRQVVLQMAILDTLQA